MFFCSMWKLFGGAWHSLGDSIKGQGVKTGVLKGQGAQFKFGQGAAPFYFVLEETLNCVSSASS